MMYTMLEQCQQNRKSGFFTSWPLEVKVTAETLFSCNKKIKHFIKETRFSCKNVSFSYSKLHAIYNYNKLLQQ